MTSDECLNVLAKNRRQAYPFGSDSEQEEESPDSTRRDIPKPASDDTKHKYLPSAMADNQKTSFPQSVKTIKRGLSFGLPGKKKANPVPSPTGKLKPTTVKGKQLLDEKSVSFEEKVDTIEDEGLDLPPGLPKWATVPPKDNISIGMQDISMNGPKVFKTMIAEQDSEEENEKVQTFVGNEYDAPSPKKQNVSATEAQVAHLQQTPGELPCSIFFVNKDAILQRFETFDELSEFLVSSALSGSVNSIEVKQKFATLLKIPLKNANHFATVGAYLKFLYESDRLMDVIIDVSGTRFGAHRIALCCHSDYFAELFRDVKADKIPFELKVTGVEPPAFGAFLEFCYTGEVSVTPEIAGDMLLVADFLRVPALQIHYDLMHRHVTLEQALKIVMKTKKRSGDMFQSLFKMVQDRFPEAADISCFLDMDIELLCLFLRSDSLVVPGEYSVFVIAMRWVLHSPTERLKHTVRVTQLIRFGQMTPDELLMCAETNEHIRGYDKFREQVLIASWILTCIRLGREDPFLFPRSSPRCYTAPKPTRINETEETAFQMPEPLMTSTPRANMTSPVNSPIPKSLDILVVGGFAGDGSAVDNPKFVERYDTGDNQWVHFCRLPAPRRHHAVATIGDHLYLIGGADPTIPGKRHTPTNTVFRMKISTKEWEPVANMNEARFRHCACAKDRKIYVFGGKGHDERVLRSVECYDEQTAAWYYLPQMSAPRFGAMTSCLGDRIFVAGGVGDSLEVPSTLSVLRSVVCYDVTQNCWFPAGDLRIPRCLGNLVTVNGRLFVCGGATRSFNYKNSVLSSVASIDEYDVRASRWNHVADLLIPRHDMGVAVAGPRIYIIGGVTTTGERELQSVECYDTTSGTWIPGVQELPYPAKSICCTVVAPRAIRPSDAVI